MDFKIKIVSLCFIFLHSSITVYCREECPSCLHLGYKFTNIPSSSDSRTFNFMSIYNTLRNPACKANTIRPTGCKAPGLGLVSTCENMVVTVNAKGINSLYPEVGMEMDIVTRVCESRPRSEADTCNHISSVWDAGSQVYFMRNLQSITNQFNSVSYNGQVCYNSQRRGTGGDGGSYQNTTKDSSVSSANIVSVCKVAYFVWTLVLLKAFY